MAKTPVKHIVFLMLENRGFDSVLGYLYKPQISVKDDYFLRPLPSQVLPASKAGDSMFNGLIGADTNALANDGIKPQPGVRASNSPGWDPGEEYEHVNMQLFGSESNPSPGQRPVMKGFVKDYATKCTGDAEAKKQIMHCYTPGTLPILNTLAQKYAVSDSWFASVPSQTNANRAYSLCGTSMGLVNNGEKTKGIINHWLEADAFDTKTILGLC